MLNNQKNADSMAKNDIKDISKFAVWYQPV